MRRIIWFLLLLCCLTACQAGGSVLTEETAAKTPAASVYHHTRMVSRMPLAPPPPPVPPVPLDELEIHSDWSQLTAYQPQTFIYRNWYEDVKDELIPSDEYGPLYPFFGQDCGDLKYHDEPYLYGLMTRDGQIVVGPVYYYVNAICYANDGSYVFSLTTPVGADFAESRHLAAASDGSWVIDGDYVECGEIDKEAFYLLNADGEYQVYSRQGVLLRSFSAEEHELSYWKENGIFLCEDQTTGAYYFFDPCTGEVVLLPGVAYPHTFENRQVCIKNEEGLYGYVDTKGHWTIQPVFSELKAFGDDGYTLAAYPDGRKVVIDTAGQVRAELETKYSIDDLWLRPTSISGQTYFAIEKYRGMEKEIIAIYDAAWTLYEGVPLAHIVICGKAGILLRVKENEYQWAGEEKVFTLPNLYKISYITNKGIYCYDGSNFDRYGQIIEEDREQLYNFTSDEEWGSYVMDSSSAYHLYDQSGQYVLTIPPEYTDPNGMYYDIILWDDVILMTGMGCSVVMDLKGNIILRYPLDR